MKTRTKPLVMDRIAHQLGSNHLTVTEARTELDRLETEDKPPFSPADIQARKERGERWDAEDAEYERSLVRRPKCFEARGMLKSDVVAEMNALTMRCLLAAGMVA